MILSLLYFHCSFWNIYQSDIFYLSLLLLISLFLLYLLENCLDFNFKMFLFFSAFILWLFFSNWLLFWLMVQYFLLLRILTSCFDIFFSPHHPLFLSTPVLFWSLSLKLETFLKCIKILVCHSYLKGMKSWWKDLSLKAKLLWVGRLCYR